MYAVDDLDQVIPYPDIPRPDFATPIPLVLSDEGAMAVAFITGDDEVAVVRFPGFAAYLFGQPNDEALSGHPLESRGLESYAAYEIGSSSWIRSLERQNSVHPRHDPSQYARLRHFIIAFHDSTLECVAEAAEVWVRHGPLPDMWVLLKKTLDEKSA